MDRKLAEELLPLVNDRFDLMALVEYAKVRTEAHHRVMEQSFDLTEMLRAQGALAELKRLATLRDEVLAAGKTQSQ